MTWWPIIWLKLSPLCFYLLVCVGICWITHGTEVVGIHRGCREGFIERHSALSRVATTNRILWDTNKRRIVLLLNLLLIKVIYSITLVISRALECINRVYYHSIALAELWNGKYLIIHHYRGCRQSDKQCTVNMYSPSHLHFLQYRQWRSRKRDPPPKKKWRHHPSPSRTTPPPHSPSTATKTVQKMF